MFKSLSTSLIARGIAALAVGVIALAWPQVTVLALVILFAVYAFTAAGLQAARAFSSATAVAIQQASGWFRLVCGLFRYALATRYGGLLAAGRRSG